MHPYFAILPNLLSESPFHNHPVIKAYPRKIPGNTFQIDGFSFDHSDNSRDAEIPRES